MDPKPDTVEPMETYQITTRNHSRSLLNRTTTTTTTTPKMPSRRAHYRKIIASTTTTTTTRRDDDDDVESAESSTATTPPPSDAFTCGVCAQVLPSSPELDRHVHATHPILFGSTRATTDSDSDGEYARTRKSARKRRFENNNNNYSPVDEQNNNDKRKADCFKIEASDETLDGSDLLSHAKKRSKQNSINNNNNNNDDEDIEDGRAQKYRCPVCDREDFASSNVLETHLEDVHPEFEIKCASCNLGFKNHRVLNLHRFMVHHEPTTTTAASAGGRVPEAPPRIRGFKDLTFVDFSSGKFPTIARVACERDAREVSRDDGVRFECRLCRRAFPCAFSLDIHARDCADGARRRVGPVDPGRNDDDDVDDGGGGGGETRRRDSFFAQLDLRNTSASENSDDGGANVDGAAAGHRLKEYLSVKPELGSLLVGDRPDTKDLADIQSIISVTSTGGLLQQLTAKERDETPPERGGACASHDSNSNAASGGHGGDDEHQDDFAAEFRRMKLRGEFPCRLCTAVFPNLRALKGHNRAHLSGAGNAGPYRCNMCPHSSGDKAALVRHMRSHNGDRPYECSICNYAFTTKANCERHLRNRHAKVTRDEVKRSIVYHPSEDPTNEEIASKVYGDGKPFRDDAAPARLLYGAAEIATPTMTPTMTPQPKASIGFVQQAAPPPPTTPLETRFGLQIPDLNELRKYIPGLGAPARERPFDAPTPKCDLTALKEHRIAPKVAYDEALNLSNARKEDTPARPMPKIHVRRFDDLKRTSIESDDDDDDKNGQTGTDDESGAATPVSRYRNERRRRRDSDPDPIDLSMDVLDLSKKKKTRSDDGSVGRRADDDVDDDDDDPVQEQPKDLSKRTLEYSSTPGLVYDRTRQFLLARQLLNGAPTPNTPVEFYANHLQSIYRTGLAGSPFTGLPAFGIGPYFRTPTHPFLTPTTSPLELHEMHDRLQKEIMRGLQLSGGGLIVDQYGAQPRPFNGDPKPTDLEQQQRQQQQPSYGLKVDEVKPAQVERTGAYGGDSPPCRTPATKAAESIIATTPNSVKMVIKNGVLMPKQKQRRYRTERPFSCEHCSARFTLRSNMERHIKQQHPQFWSQRQRSNVAGVPGRKPHVHVVAAPSQQQQQQQQKTYFEQRGAYEYYARDVDAPKRPEEFSAEKVGAAFEQPTAISEQVKYAILAQQLKQAMRKDDVVPDVVVDEEVDENDALVIDEGSQSQESRHGGGGSGGGIDVEDDAAKKKTSLEESMLKLKLIQRKLLEHERDGVDGATASSKRCDEEAQDLVPVSRLLDNASQIPFSEYFGRDGTGGDGDEEEVAHSDDDEEEGLVSASGSASESGGNASGSDGNRSESETQRAKRRAADATPTTSASSTPAPPKKKSAYSLAPNRVTCPYCHRKFPWSSSLRRHVLTHTGQKPYKCPHCPLLFTTKSNCDRHLLRKHGNVKSSQTQATSSATNNETKSIGGDASKQQQQQQTKQQPTDASSFLMRNVPERPFKCSSCPSSTFSTLNNLKKHVSFKHSGASSPGSPRSGDDGAQTRPGSSQCGYESHSSEDERCGVARRKNSSDWESGSTHAHAGGAPCTSELPFKCHLCDGSYAERQETLDHIRERHGAEYELLVSKGALETNATHPAHAGEQHDAVVDGARPPRSDDQHSDHDEHGGCASASASTALMRGKFPDYANRKVICAFCMRRFWSAEDLRRHMRTHNGARPFSCDVCRRRFTLKHSMLRHRKKHNVNVAAASDVEYDAKERVCRDDDAVETDGGVVAAASDRRRRSACDDVEQGSDLIGNLLGIRDRSIIDQVLVSSADDAAKLLGVDKTE